jgi:diphosphomevalonate decarboxylase
MSQAPQQATARAHSNIAFIKYWGNADEKLRLPANPSLSMNLANLYTDTTLRWDRTLTADTLTLNGETAAPKTLQRVTAFLDVLRQHIGITGHAHITSTNNFPMGAGIASSASAFAALTLAAIAAAGLNWPERQLTTIARLGSGSAARSIPCGFVEWRTGDTHEKSFAESFAPPDYWEIVDVIAIISDEHKAVVSREGHETANTSDLQTARVFTAGERLRICKQAILDKDFRAFAEVVEHDSNLMHAVMMTSKPPLFYWLPATLTVMKNVRQWRGEGLEVCYTLDAGPNVHCICVRSVAEEVRRKLQAMSEVKHVRVSKPGGPALILESTFNH